MAHQSVSASLFKMKLSLTKLEKYGFNQKILTEADFYEICEREQITVLELDVPASFYFSVLGKHFIVLRKRLRGLRRTFVMFHELAHYFLHGGKAAECAFFFGLLENKNEIEAEAMATVALIPKFALDSYDFLEDHPNRYARKLFENRQKLEFLYGI